MALFTSDSTIRYGGSFSKKLGGAESNVAIGLTRLGYSVGWVSRLGNDELGKFILSFIRGEGIDVSQVSIDKHAQTGIYIKELRHAADVRVQYYRKFSAASYMSEEDLDEEYLSKAKYLHLTGITPALSESAYKMTLKAIEIAKKNGTKIIFDPNIRQKLWSKDLAKEVLLQIALQSDIFLPGLSEATFLTDEEQPEKIGEYFRNRGVSIVVMKDGEKGAYYSTNKEFHHVPGFYVKNVIDPVGAGDGFAAGFISGLLDKLSIHEAVERGNAVGALVTMVNGDFEGLPYREELERFLNHNNVDVSR